MRADRCREHAATLLDPAKIRALGVLLDWTNAVAIHACTARLEVHDHDSCCRSCDHHVIPHTRCILR